MSFLNGVESENVGLYATIGAARRAVSGIERLLTGE